MQNPPSGANLMRWVFACVFHETYVVTNGKACAHQTPGLVWQQSIGERLATPQVRPSASPPLRSCHAVTSTSTAFLCPIKSIARSLSSSKGEHGIVHHFLA